MARPGECWEYGAENDDPARTFACQHSRNENHGCGVHCTTCEIGLQGPEVVTGAPIDGTRWARPSMSSTEHTRELIIVSAPPFPRASITEDGRLRVVGINDWRAIGVRPDHQVRILGFREEGHALPDIDGVYEIDQWQPIPNELRIEWTPELEGTAWFQVFDAEVALRQVNARDARGFFSPLRSNVPHLCTDSTTMELGVCYDNKGQECFDWGICNCWPPPSQADCPAGEPTEGLQPDCTLYTGSGYPMKTECRLKTDDKSRVFQTRPQLFTGSRMDQMLSIRSASPGDEMGLLFAQRCTNNWAVNNWGKWATQCPNSGDPPLPDSYYVNTGAGFYHTLWTYARLLWDVGDLPSISIDDTLHHITPARRLELEAKNRALAFITTHQFPGVRFDRMDAEWLRLGTNTFLDKWARGWRASVPQTANSHGDFQEVLGVDGEPMFTGRLHRTGCPVNIRMMLVAVDVVMSLVLHRERDEDPTNLDPNKDNNCYPSVRLAMTIRAVPRIEIVSPCEGVTIDYAPFGDPIIVGDSLVLPTPFPFETEWQGGRGMLVAPRWENRIDLDVLEGFDHSRYGYSRAIIAGVNAGDGYRVDGIFTDSHPSNPAIFSTTSRYRGGLNLKFCGEAVPCG